VNRSGPLLALDIGGANLKAAHSSGAGASKPFAVWKRPGDLPRALADLAIGFPPAEQLVVTMTAELCDCFQTKREGVRHVLDALVEAFPMQAIEVWGLDGRFHTIGAIRDDPLMAASANWLALAIVAARLAGKGVGLLIDIGSTTSDLIPLIDGEVAAVARTDSGRLGSGELVYAGVRRTPICALADRLPYRGRATGLAAELFATTLDVYLTLGKIPENPTDLDTADGRPSTIEAARDRLARMVGADRETFGIDDASQLAGALDNALVARLAEAADRGCVQRFERPMTVVVSGSGEFLASRVAGSLVAVGGRIVSLTELWGGGLSEWACAKALLDLAEGARRG
jgi:probable H4MPT-linked C1 transfer pathway protein